MRNRAKCRKCGDIIESTDDAYDVTCKCDEIGINGGSRFFGARANDFANFLRINDNGEQIKVRYMESAPEPTKKDLMNELDEQLKRYESLPPHVKYSSITETDLYYFKVWFKAYLVAKEE